MRVGSSVTNYEVTLTDSDIEVLIECIRKSRLSDCRDQVQAWSLLDDFVGIFLDENKDKYVNRYIKLVGRYLEHDHHIEPDKIAIMLDKTREDIEDVNGCVFHHNPEDWAERIAEVECNNMEDMPRKLMFSNW